MTLKIASFIKKKYGNSLSLIENMLKIPEIKKILSITGDFDFLIEIEAENSEDFVEILEAIEKIPDIHEIHSHYIISEWEK